MQVRSTLKIHKLYFIKEGKCLTYNTYYTVIVYDEKIFSLVNLKYVYIDLYFILLHKLIHYHLFRKNDALGTDCSA